MSRTVPLRNDDSVELLVSVPDDVDPPVVTFPAVVVPLDSVPEEVELLDASPEEVTLDTV